MMRALLGWELYLEGPVTAWEPEEGPPPCLSLPWGSHPAPGTLLLPVPGTLSHPSFRLCTASGDRSCASARYVLMEVRGHPLGLWARGLGLHLSKPPHTDSCGG